MKALQNSLYIYGRGGEDHTLFEIRTLEIFCITYLVTMFIYMCKAAINVHLFIIYLFNAENFDNQVKAVIGAHMKEYRNKWQTTVGESQLG